MTIDTSVSVPSSSGLDPFFDIYFLLFLYVSVPSSSGLDKKRSVVDATTEGGFSPLFIGVGPAIPYCLIFSTISCFSPLFIGVGLGLFLRV